MSNQNPPAQTPQPHESETPAPQAESHDHIDFAQRIKQTLQKEQSEPSQNTDQSGPTQNADQSGPIQNNDTAKEQSQQGPEKSDDPAANQKNQQDQVKSGSNSAQDQSAKNQDQSEEKEYFPNIKMEESRVAPGIYKPLPEEKILVWKAPSRPFKKHNKKYFSTITVIALLISLILGFAGQLIAVTVVIAITFLVYALSVTPPQEIENQITTYGIRLENNLYYWQELGRFWFTDKYGQEILNIETIRFPGRITLLLADQDKELITQILSEVLLHQKPDPTPYEKVSAWLQEKVPLDIDA